MVHELGHALVARPLGIPVREVVLLHDRPRRGACAEPEGPMDELLIAAAGPAVKADLIGAPTAVIGVKLYLTAATGITFRST